MRGEWIEIIFINGVMGNLQLRLSPCGESGLKYGGDVMADRIESLSPCGESGLKFTTTCYKSCKIWSLPMRGEWIEIFSVNACGINFMSLPMRGEWIEIYTIPLTSTGYVSLPMRGEWIEIARAGTEIHFEISLSPCGESGLKLDWLIR